RPADAGLPHQHQPQRRRHPPPAHGPDPRSSLSAQRWVRAPRSHGRRRQQLLQPGRRIPPVAAGRAAHLFAGPADLAHDLAGVLGIRPEHGRGRIDGAAALHPFPELLRGGEPQRPGGPPRPAHRERQSLLPRRPDDHQRLRPPRQPAHLADRLLDWNPPTLMVPVNARVAPLGILLFAWFTATGAIGTCAFFKPTEPEPPTNKNPIIPDYSSPTMTLETLAKGVADKSQSNGQTVYLDGFADSTGADGAPDGRAFHGFFDLRDLQARPTWDRNRDWNKPLEPVMYSALVRLFSNPYEMTWGPYERSGNESSPNGNDSLLHRKYTIMQVVKSGNTVTRSPVAIGAADLYFVKS